MNPNYPEYKQISRICQGFLNILANWQIWPNQGLIWWQLKMQIKGMNTEKRLPFTIVSFHRWDFMNS